MDKGYISVKCQEWYDVFMSFLRYDRLYDEIAESIILLLYGSTDEKKVLDVGCGTGTLLIKLKKRFPHWQLTGIDPDERMLAVAKKKAGKQDIKVEWAQAGGQALPFPENSFDLLVSSLAIHHIPREFRQKAFAEMFRVLKPEAPILIVDVGVPRSFFGKLIVAIAPLIKEDFTQNVQGLISKWMEEVGLQNVREMKSKFGFISFWEGKK